MTRLQRESVCELWERAKRLAPALGVSLENERCITESICDGSFCSYISEVGDFGPAQIEKFRTRQEKTDAIQLAKIRRFLQSQTEITKQDIGQTWD